jgi:histidinol-phosphate aminotransferase
MNTWIKAAVRALPGAPGAAATKGGGDAVALHANESAFDWPDDFKRRVIESFGATAWNRYPESRPAALIERISAYAGAPSEGIVVGNGSDELIQTLFLAGGGPGARVIVPDPGFVVYGIAGALADVAVIGAALDRDFRYDVEGLIRLVVETDPAFTIVCSPNNPTGGSMSVADIARVAEAARGLVVVDEAYAEFSGVTALSLVAERPNVVILRTLSKAFALAGLRVGYLIARPELAREFDKARPTFNVNAFSQAAAIAALGDDGPDQMRRRVRAIVASRERLRERLARTDGLRAYPSDANFLLVEFAGRAGRDVARSLADRGVLVRFLAHSPRLERCVRLSVGTDRQNDRAVEAIEEILR